MHVTDKPANQANLNITGWDESSNVGVISLVLTHVSAKQVVCLACNVDAASEFDCQCQMLSFAVVVDKK